MNWWKLFLGIAFIIACIGVGFSVFRDNSETYSLKTLKTKSGYVVDLRAGYDSEITQPIYCKVVKNAEIIFPLKRIGFTTNSAVLKFVLIEDEDNKLLAIIEEATPYIVLAIYDLKNRRAWFFFDPDGWQEGYVVPKEFLQRLNKNNPEKPFVLRGEGKRDEKSRIW